MYSARAAESLGDNRGVRPPDFPSSEELINPPNSNLYVERIVARRPVLNKMQDRTCYTRSTGVLSSLTRE